MIAAVSGADRAFPSTARKKADGAAGAGEVLRQTWRSEINPAAGVARVALRLEANNAAGLVTAGIGTLRKEVVQ